MKHGSIFPLDLIKCSKHPSHFKK